MISLQLFLNENNAINLSNEELKELMSIKKINIQFSKDNSLVLLKYGIDADFYDPVVKNARGIILYRKDFSIACYPFNKFGNYTESYCDEIDWKTAKVQEKIDGSIMKIWYNKLTNKWMLSTNGTIDANDAPIYGNNKSFAQLFYDAKSKIDYNKLDKNNTYIFELVSPENRIVIYYPYTDIYHIGTRNNNTCEEISVDIGIQKPKEYNVNTLEDSIKYCNDICTPDDRHEGFVVVDDHYSRIKIKNAFYITCHYLKGKVEGNIKTVLEFLDSGDIDEFKSYMPESNHILLYYEWQMSEFKYQLRKFLYKCLNLKQSCKDKKEYALSIKDCKFSYFGFKLYEGEEIEDIISKIKYTNLSKYIEPYKSKIYWELK